MNRLRFIKQSFIAISLLLLIGAGAGFAAVQLRGGKLFSVQSGSMAPYLHKGDLIAVTRVPNKSQLAVGDVVTYVKPHHKQTITHRIVELPTISNYNKIIVKGDSNKSADTPVDPSQIIGKVNYHERYLGYGIDFLHRPIGLTLIVYIPAILIIIEEIKRLARYYEIEKPYKLIRFRKQKNNGALSSEFAGKLGLLIIVALIASGVAALPAIAALSTQTVLAGNTLSAIKPGAVGHVLIRQVKFECSSDNTTQLNNLPQILIYNPTNRDLSGGNWTLRTSSRTVVTFRPQTIFDSKDNYDVEPDLINGLNYAGDSLGLYNNLGQLVDGISWGTDTSQFNPPLPTPAQQTQYRRVSVTTDTNTAADWAVSVQGCETGN